MLVEMSPSGLQIIQQLLEHKQGLYLQQPHQILQLLVLDMKGEELLMPLDSMLGNLMLLVDLIMQQKDFASTQVVIWAWVLVVQYQTQDLE